MTRELQNLLVLNVVLFGTALLTGVMMVLWARATRGRWPSHRRIQFTVGYCLLVWLFGNMAYFYFRSH